MIGMPAIPSVSTTARQSLDALSARFDEVVQQAAGGADGAAQALTKLPELAAQSRAQLLVLSTLDQLAADLLQHPRR